MPFEMAPLMRHLGLLARANIDSNASRYACPILYSVYAPLETTITRELSNGYK